ncbi:hypothetical protein CAPTEDRAFT_213975 [Capitella teleta]|uniref:Uncharacterized protein n=1 Tax=Capitella teleta TaxID=283909 RepID=R7TNX8_CAPTE|nr:hypothetical protein CAPTEDRAFT_213975 [Capitella teleta]|eukprot:ELT95262.1 hypothetical protein CAPTEDRAFT_213975 [Capitella teleta]
MGKKKHVPTKEKPKLELDEDFTLDNVLKLGGTKKDYEWLNEVDDEDEVLDKEDINADPVNRDQLRQLISELGFYEEEDPDEQKEKPKEKEKKKELAKETTEPKPETSGEKKKKIKNKFKVQCDEVSSTVVEKPREAKIEEDQEVRTTLFVKPGGKWHDHEFQNDPSDFEAPRLLQVQRTKAQALKIFEQEVEIFNKQQLKNSESRWMKTMLTKGTLGDKLASLTLHLQEAPVHNLASIDSLIAMTEKKGRREATMAAETFKDLLLSDLLPDRKLRSFDQRPLNQLDELSSGNFISRNKRLLLWYYEGELKSKVSQFLDMLELCICFVLFVFAMLNYR